MESIIPSRIYTLFPQVGFNDLTSYPRINKWFSSINLITKSPIFGFGAASFPILYSFKEERFEHSHNLPLELALSYGFITSFIIFSFYATLLYLSFKKISSLSKLNNIELGSFLNKKAWYASSLIFLLSHLFDIQYFDVRISTLCWILLAGLKCFINEKTEFKKNKL